MKTKFFLVSLILLSFSSCKNDEKKSEDSEPIIVEKPLINPEIFTVTFTAIIKKDDSFQIYFKNLETDTFEEKNSIFKEFKGSDEPQDIVFEMPEAFIPNFFRMDFGVNKQQSEIIVKNLKLSYQGKDFNINQSQYFDYFIPNDLTVKFDKSSSKVLPLLTKEGVYDPMAYSGLILYDQIQTLIK